MLMLLIRTFLWSAAVLALGLAFDFLRDSTGGVTIDLNGRLYGPFKPLEFVGVIVALTLVLWGLWKLFGFLVALVRFFAGDETALSRYWNRARERRGFDAAAESMISLSEGDGRTALARARRAERLLNRPGLTRVLVAQSAEASGDTPTARRYYKQLASDPKTAYAGTRGLLAEALKKGETGRALKLAQHAFTLRPKSEDVLTGLFSLQSQTEDWKGARKTLHAAIGAKTLGRDVALRREAVLLLAEARDTDDDALRRDLTLRANRKSPGLAAAAIDAAMILNADGAERKARNVIKDAWRHNPHPDLAAAYAQLAPDETASARRERFDGLLALKPEDDETKMLAAELALADEDFPGARRALGDVAERAPTARSLALMAAIERGEGKDEAAVRGWLARAVTAARGPNWTCENCGAVHEAWAPTCSSCGAFDSMTWRLFESPAGASADAAMAPLLATGGGAVVAAAEEADATGEAAEKA